MYFSLGKQSKKGGCTDPDKSEIRIEPLSHFAKRKHPRYTKKATATLKTSIDIFLFLAEYDLTFFNPGSAVLRKCPISAYILGVITN